MNRLSTVAVALVVTMACGQVLAQSPEPRLRQMAASQLGIDTSQVVVTLVDELSLKGELNDYTFKFAAGPRGRTVVRGMSTNHRDIAFTVRVELWDDVLVARVPLTRGTPLNADDFVTVRREVTHVAPAKTADLTLLRTRRRIPAGSILVQDAVETIPDVNRGDRVTLVAVSGAIKVTRTGVALKDARIGETVRVRLDGRTIVPATVTGAHLCVVGP